MEPWFLDLICSGKLFKKQFIPKQSLLSFLLPERCVTNHTGNSMKGLSGRELRPEVLLDN